MSGRQSRTRVYVVLSPPRRMHDLCAYAKAIFQCVSQDPLFSPPSGVLPALETSILALDEALVSAHSRTGGTAAARKARQKEVLYALQRLRAYVQELTGAQPLHEAAIIPKRAGMEVKNTKGHSRAALAVKDGRVSGTARVSAAAAKSRGSYEWQYALEGEPGISVPATHVAEVTLENLVPGALYWVRVRSLTRAGASDWSLAVTFRVG